MKKNLSILIALLAVTIFPMEAFGFPNMKLFPHKVVKLEDFGSPDSYCSERAIDTSIVDEKSLKFHYAYDPTTNLKVYIDPSLQECSIENSDGIVEFSEGKKVSRTSGRTITSFLFKEKGRLNFTQPRFIGEPHFIFQTYENDSTEKNL